MIKSSPLKLAVVMDPIEKILPENDTTVHLLQAAQKNNFSITYLPQDSLHITAGHVFGCARPLQITEEPFANGSSWYRELTKQEDVPLHQFDVILMRKDPPFTLEYIYTTHMLEFAEQQGVLVLNQPQSLRDANEKLWPTHFPACCPPTLISQNLQQLYAFWEKEKEVVFKPLDGMAGQSIFVAHADEPNVPVIIEMLSKKGQTPILVQRYLPEIHTSGDKRILLINGKPIPYALARFPKRGETRANLAVGGKGVVVPLTDRDYWLCEQIGPILKQKKLLFVGIDVIGDYITEINVTSPTGLPAITRATSINIADQFMQIILHLL